MTVMNVAFGTTAYNKTVRVGGVDGIGNVTLGLFNELSAIPDIKLNPVSFAHINSAAIDLPLTKDLGNFKQQLIKSQIFGKNFEDKLLKSLGIDVFHATDHYIPKFKNIPVIATVHDAIPFYKQFVPLKYKAIAHALKKSIISADLVVTPSLYSKEDLVSKIGISPDKIIVIPNGIAKEWYDPIDSSVIANVQSDYGIHKKYIVTIGTIQPRKNIEGVLAAYTMLPDSLRNDYDLVVIGKLGSNSNSQYKLLTNYIHQNKGIRWLRYVSDSDVHSLIRGASCLCYPSLIEGFGLPVIESFASNVPVLTSNTTSLAEIASNAALTVNPTNFHEISEGLRLILSDSNLRSQMIAKGATESQKYRWHTASAMYISAYRQICR